MQKVFSPLLQIGLCTFGYLYATSEMSLAQVTTDGTVNTQVNQTDNVAEITGGETRGSNLFHSFQEFSVRPGNQAFFNNADSISNIFSRVTGGSVSNIDGLIRANGSASLFLINPAGIIFGEGASLDIGGSFYGSSADSILFEDGEFSAADLENPPVLTVNAPIGLNLRDNPQPIVNRSQAPDSSGLGLVQGFQASPGKNLALIGGDVNIERAVVAASGGRIELGGLSAAGTVNFNIDDGSFSFPEGVERSNVFLNNAIVDVSASSEGGGLIAVNAKNLELKERSQLAAGILSVGIGGDIGSPDTQAGNIFINATDKITLDEFSRISNSVSSGDIGQPGDINIITNSLSLTNGSQIFANTFGAANSGTVRIKATDISADGVDGFGNTSGIFSTIEQGAIGNSGGIDITTANLSLTNGARVDSSTSARGNAGKINIITKNLFLTNSFIASNVRLQEAQGNAGNIRVISDNLSLTNGAKILVNTFGKGDAGDLFVSASSIKIDGGENGIFTALSGSVESGATGRGGNITIGNQQSPIEDLNLTNGAQILVNTFGKGDAGNLSIFADDIEVSGEGDFPSGLFASSEEDATGNAGNINISTSFLEVTNNGVIRNRTSTQGNAGNLTINARKINLNAGRIDASTFGSGAGGDLTITASEIKLSGSSGTFPTSIFNKAIDSTGNAGNLTINTGTLTIRDQSSIDVGNFVRPFPGTTPPDLSPGQGAAGILKINADFIEVNNAIISADNANGVGGELEINTNSMSLENGASVVAETTSDTGTGGSINLNVDGTLQMRDNSLISGRAIKGATGGKVNINANFLIAYPDGNNDILADAQQGRGGEITINVESLFGIQKRDLNPKTNDINASSRFNLDGSVNVNTAGVNPIQGATELPTNRVESGETTQQACEVNRDGTAQNGLTIQGKGGIPPAPDLPLNSQNISVNGEIDPTISAIPEPIETSIGKIQPARGIKVTKDGRVILTAYRTNNAGERIPEIKPNCN